MYAGGACTLVWLEGLRTFLVQGNFNKIQNPKSNNGKHRNKGRNDDGSSPTGQAREPTSIWTANKFTPLGELPLAVRESGALFLGLTGSTAQCCKAAERPGGLAVWASATRLELNSYGQTNKQTNKLRQGPGGLEPRRGARPTAGGSQENSWAMNCARLPQ